MEGRRTLKPWFVPHNMNLLNILKWLLSSVRPFKAKIRQFQVTLRRDSRYPPSTCSGEFSQAAGVWRFFLVLLGTYWNPLVKELFGIKLFCRLVLYGIKYPLLINDLVNILKHSKGLSFADDTKLIRSVNGMECMSLLQEDLWLVISWSLLNNMQLHEKKLEVLNYSLNSSLLLR